MTATVVGFVGVVLIVGTSLLAQRPPGRYTVYGAGTVSCGQWVERKGADEYVFSAWVSGFVSGVGFTNTLKPTDRAAMTQWISNYCQMNPLKDLSEATQALVMELAQ